MYLEIFPADFAVFRVFWGNFAGPRLREISEALLIKISIQFTGFSCYQYMYVVSPCVLCETGTVVYNSYIETN